ncbi:MAG: hypothetical protein ACKVS9_17500 [Phycisphaerae bacterium]
MRGIEIGHDSTTRTLANMLQAVFLKIRNAWFRASGSQQSLYAAGVLLILSGAFHVGVWGASERNWEGPLSWRKPILFGLSTGVTCLSLGWVLGWLRWGKTERIIAVPTAIAAVVEVGLITLQTWRGVASHFNVTTPFDTFVNYAVDALITLITLAIFAMTLRSFGPLRKRNALPLGDLALAIRFGMVLLSLGCLFGYWMLWYGARQVGAGQPPEVLGAAGVVKFVHGTPIHAVQALPICCWLLSYFSVGVQARTRAVALLGIGFGLLTLFAAVQTFRGRARADLDMLSAAVLALAALMFLAPLWLAMSRRSPRRQSAHARQ